jgi:hypothetical protein
VNLFTKYEATIAGVIFSGVFFTIFTLSERHVAKERHGKAEQLDQFRIYGNQEELFDQYAHYPDYLDWLRQHPPKRLCGLLCGCPRGQFTDSAELSPVRLAVLKPLHMPRTTFSAVNNTL